jgi:hypothetical protein
LASSRSRCGKPASTRPWLGGGFALTIAAGISSDQLTRLCGQLAGRWGQIQHRVQAGDAGTELLREQVTSKGGTTAAAFEGLRAAGVGERFVEAVLAALARSRELEQSFGRGAEECFVRSRSRDIQAHRHRRAGANNDNPGGVLRAQSL